MNVPGLRFPEYCNKWSTNNSSMKNDPSSRCLINVLMKRGCAVYSYFSSSTGVQSLSIADWVSAQPMEVSKGLDMIWYNFIISTSCTSWFINWFRTLSNELLGKVLAAVQGDSTQVGDGGGLGNCGRLGQWFKCSSSPWNHREAGTISNRYNRRLWKWKERLRLSVWRHVGVIWTRGVDGG